MLPSVPLWVWKMSQLNQNINFYRDEFKKPEIKLPASQMLQVVAICLTGFVVIGGYQAWSLHQLQQKIDSYQQKRTALENQYESLEASFVEPKEDPNLLADLAAINNDVQQKTKLKSFLLRESSKSLFSFAAVLDSLANADAPGIWLTQVGISTQGNQYELKGITQQADAIPNYIEKLKQAEVLKGTSFSIFSLERDQKSSALLHFTLSSEEVDGEREG